MPNHMVPLKFEVGGWVVLILILMTLCGPSFKLRLARFSTRLKYQDGGECGNKLGSVKNFVWLIGFEAIIF